MKVLISFVSSSRFVGMITRNFTHSCLSFEFWDVYQFAHIDRHISWELPLTRSQHKWSRKNHVVDEFSLAHFSLLFSRDFLILSRVLRVWESYFFYIVQKSIESLNWKVSRRFSKLWKKFHSTKSIKFS